VSGRRGVVTVVPVTANTERVYPSRLLPSAECGLRHDSKAQAEQVRSIDVTRLGRRVGPLSPGLLERALRLRLGLCVDRQPSWAPSRPFRLRSCCYRRVTLYILTLLAPSRRSNAEATRVPCRVCIVLRIILGPMPEERGSRVGSSLPDGIVERFVGLVAAAALRIAGHRVISSLCKCEFVLVLESGSVFVGYRAVQGVVDGDMSVVEVACLDGYR
jgi:hypothetical protein